MTNALAAVRGALAEAASENDFSRCKIAPRT